MQKKTILSVAGLSLALTAAAVLCAQVLLRNLSALLSFDETFGTIFAQIADAPMSPPVAVTLLLSLGAAILLHRLWQKKPWRFAAALCGLGFGVLLFLLNVLLTRVNGIRFCDVLFSLLDVLEKGGL